MSRLLAKKGVGAPTIAPTGALAAAFAAARAALLAAAALTVAAMISLAAAPCTAWAAGGDNLVNPQQRPDSSFIYDTPISALSSADTYYDNQTVQVVGEAVGDAIHADVSGGHCWVMLSSQEQGVSYTISVYMSASAAARIDTFGRYGAQGTELQVRGTFHLVCPDHEGVSDIHADVVSVVDPGAQHFDEFKLEAFVPGAVTIVAGLVLMLVFYRLRERQR